MTGSPLPIVPVIVGPTASGKSALAMALAEREAVTIISADSRQLYRGFDIGTAKPTVSERARVPHEGLDVIEPTARWSAARWAASAERWIAGARAASRVPLIVGGTGFYLQALFQPLAAVPDLDPARRARLAAFLDGLSLEELERWCLALDPARATLGRTQRLRAIETALLDGTRISEHHRAARPAPRLSPRYLLVDPGPALAARIESRVDRMLEDGWLGEVRSLAGAVPGDAPGWKATGYLALRSHLEGQLSLDEARHRVVIATRQYAKRQRTWLRHQLHGVVTRVDPTAPEAWTRVMAWWEEARTE